MASDNVIIHKNPGTNKNGNNDTMHKNTGIKQNSGNPTMHKNTGTKQNSGNPTMHKNAGIKQNANNPTMNKNAVAKENANNPTMHNNSGNQNAQKRRSVQVTYDMKREFATTKEALEKYEEYLDEFEKQNSLVGRGMVG